MVITEVVRLDATSTSSSNLNPNIVTRVVMNSNPATTVFRPMVTSRANKAPIYTSDKRAKFAERENKKWVRLATVVGYLISVCIPAIALSVYYVGFWDPNYKATISRDGKHKVEISQLPVETSDKETAAFPPHGEEEIPTPKCPPCECSKEKARKHFQDKKMRHTDLTSVLTDGYKTLSSANDVVPSTDNVDFDDYENSYPSHGILEKQPENKLSGKIR